jgi:hypothetical protein
VTLGAPVKCLFILILLTVTLPLAGQAGEGAVEFIRFNWKVEPNREQFYAATSELFEKFGPKERLMLYAEYGTTDGIYALTSTEEGRIILRLTVEYFDAPFLTAHIETTSPGESPLHGYLRYVYYWNESDRNSKKYRDSKETTVRFPEPLPIACKVVLRNQKGSIKSISKGQLKMIQHIARHGHLMNVTYRPGDKKGLRDFVFSFAADCVHKEEIVAELMAVMDNK